MGKETLVLSDYPEPTREEVVNILQETGNMIEQLINDDDTPCVHEISDYGSRKRRAGLI